MTLLAWMDLEMTGLDPAEHVIVEIATLLTDDDLNIIAKGPELVINVDEEALSKMDQVVVDMHTKSGLLDQIRASTVTHEQAAAETLQFLKTHISAPRSVPLCGNSIGMDRRFLAVHMRQIEEFLHYRSVDVSTLKELTRRWYPQVLADAPKKEVGHRALDDVTESINELRYYREQVFRVNQETDANSDGSSAADTGTDSSADDTAAVAAANAAHGQSAQ